jgi:hypothetical protein
MHRHLPGSGFAAAARSSEVQVRGQPVNRGLIAGPCGIEPTRSLRITFSHTSGCAAGFATSMLQRQLAGAN